MMHLPTACVQRRHAEPVETLGDTTPGAFDPLDLLAEHPAITEALAATALPAWWPWAAAVLLVSTIALSAAFPWGWAPAP